ncbi:MAG: phosphoenolpyruvate--protein phosphotransferase [Propionibacteriaceae bacterium]
MYDQLHGTGVVPGVAAGPVIWATPHQSLPEHSPTLAEDQREAAAAQFSAAADTIAARLTERASHATGVATEVLGANAALARDRGWRKAALKLIATGNPPAWATVEAIGQFVDTFTTLGGLMAERTTDLLDIRDRVLAELAGLPEPGIPAPSEPSILFAEDLAPADTAGLDPTLIVALCIEHGSPTSHTAIIARQLGIPCLVAVSDLRSIAAGTQVLVDGKSGTIDVNPDPAAAEAAVAHDERRRAAIRAWHGPAVLADGTAVQLLANVQDGPGARTAADVSDAEGIGLFRTELCFLSAQSEPSVAEQTAIYREVFEAFPGKKVVVRTLDAGSDKPLAFANMSAEDNPAMGLRGIRIATDNRDILTCQLDAIAAAGGHDAWVMAPMIATLDEARSFADDAHARGLKAGIMVEVPAVAVLARRFLDIVDFVSIGTNDLTQYTMAADRMSDLLAAYNDPWQPAVLTLVQSTAQAGLDLGKPVGVCGEAAADPYLACVLIGLGVTSLSMAATAIASVGAQLSDVTLEGCREAAALALNANDARSAREAVSSYLG